MHIVTIFYLQRVLHFLDLQRVLKILVIYVISDKEH